MKKLIVLFLVLAVMAGCRTLEGPGAAAGAGTYPEKATPDPVDTVLLTETDATKAGGFAIRRTPFSNIPVSTPMQTALNLKQDAATAATDAELAAAVSINASGFNGNLAATDDTIQEVAQKVDDLAISGDGTIVADGTDPTKAAAAVTADTMAATGLTGTIDDARIPAGVTRDSELASATVSHASTADSATTATTSQSIVPPATKTDGEYGYHYHRGASGTETGGYGQRGPTASTATIYLEKPPATPPTNGQVKVFGTPVPVSASGDFPAYTELPYTFGDMTGGDSTLTDGSTTNDILVWDGDSWEPMALASHPQLVALQSDVDTMTAAFTALGLNAFTFTPNTTFPLYFTGATSGISFEITDTSTTYDPASALWQIDSGGYGTNSLTNTTGTTWTATITAGTEGSHTLQLQASDDKSPTPNTGESVEYTVVRDDTNPALGDATASPTTHAGDGTGITVTLASVTEANEASRQYRIWNTTDDTLTEDYQSFTGLSFSDTLPADTDSYRFDLRVTDLAGNVGAGSVAVGYSAGASGFDVYEGGYTGDGTDDRSISIAGLTSSSDALIMIANDNGDYGAIRFPAQTGDVSSEWGNPAAEASDIIQSLTTDAFTVGTDGAANNNGSEYTYGIIDNTSASAYVEFGSYTGNATDNRTITLSTMTGTPDLVMIKAASAGYMVFHTDAMGDSTDTAAYMYNNANAANRIQAVGPGSFEVSNNAYVNDDGVTIYYAAFVHTPGAFITGSYTGDGTDDRAITGLGFQPDFLIVKGNAATYPVIHTDHIGDNTDSSYYLRAAGATTNAIQSLDSDGFTVGTDVSVNTTSTTYYYIAWKAGSHND